MLNLAIKVNGLKVSATVLDMDERFRSTKFELDQYGPKVFEYGGFRMYSDTNPDLDEDCILLWGVNRKKDKSPCEIEFRNSSDRDEYLQKLTTCVAHFHEWDGFANQLLAIEHVK